MLNPEDRQAILDHMNSDHEDTLRNYVRYYGGVHQVLHAELRDLTRHEMRIHAAGHDLDCVLAIPLSRPLDSASDARAVLVEMAHAARQGLQEEGNTDDE